MLQETVWLLSLVLMAVIAGLFVFVAGYAGSPPIESTSAVSNATRIRKIVFWILLIASALIILATTQTLPYVDTHRSAVAADVHVEVIGRQWSWQLSTTEAKVGQAIVFEVTSADVNHGLGIYDENLTLLAQTQAMPNYTNQLRMTFREPGVYRLLCMEYCGVAHHGMIATFTVLPSDEG